MLTKPIGFLKKCHICFLYDKYVNQFIEFNENILQFNRITDENIGFKKNIGSWVRVGLATVTGAIEEFR